MKRRLILHAGMQKTGTTSLQLFLDERYDALKSRGIVYPMVGKEDHAFMRHHWIVNALLLDDRAAFERRMELVEAECDDATHTIVLSTEAFVTHLGDFRAEPRRWLGTLRERYEVSTWLWLREPVAFCRAFYLQALRPARTASFPVYGRDITVSEFLDVPWVGAQFDYAARCRELEAIFGPDSLFAFEFADDTVADACALLGIEDLYAARRDNASWPRNVLARLLRAVNEIDLDEQEKFRVNGHILQIALIVGERGSLFELDSADIARVRALSTMDAEAIARIAARSRERWARRMATA